MACGCKKNTTVKPVAQKTTSTDSKTSVTVTTFKPKD